MNTVIITVYNAQKGYRGVMIDRKGRNRYHYDVTRSSWLRLGKVCKGWKRENMDAMRSDSVTTKLTA